MNARAKRIARKLMTTKFECNKCKCKHRVRTTRMQVNVRCICGEVFKVTKEGYEFLNNLPDERTIGQSEAVKSAIASGKILLATR